MKTKRKTRTGTVISDKMDKTVVVLVQRVGRHPLYKKVVRHTSKFKAHDEANACKVGDVVKIIETRPLSKEKRWRVAEIISRKEVVEVEPAEII
jgi:small subunit ribosomal protein S17